ncbi:MAG: helix-turn-helix transcriptional regulator [Chloroflexota bacterium]|nr:helix-turn-helix transcriptional regulator [Chloroflexota bacterium]
MRRRQPASRVRLKPEAVWSYLNRLNMSQNELARRVGISSGYLSQLMSGTRCPSAAVRVRLMEALGVTDFEDLFILEIVPSVEENDVLTPTRTGIAPTGHSAAN